MKKIMVAVTIAAALTLAACGKEPGPAGAKGETGAQGPAGPQGAQGVQGVLRDRLAPKARRVRRAPLGQRATGVTRARVVLL